MKKRTPPNEEPNTHGPTYKAAAANRWLLIWAVSTTSATLILQIWQIVKG